MSDHDDGREAPTGSALPRTIGPHTLSCLRNSFADAAVGVTAEGMIDITSTVRGIRADYQPAGTGARYESYEIEHRTLGRDLACNIESPDGVVWRSIGPLAGPDYYHRPHEGLHAAVTWVVESLDQLASTSARQGHRAHVDAAQARDRPGRARRKA